MKSTRDILNSRKWRPSTNPFEGVPVRSKGKKTRLWIDIEYFERTYAAIFPHSVTLVYCMLARHANADTQTCYPSVQRIMEKSGIKNRQTAFDAIRILEAFDIILIHRSKGRVPNIYALLDPKAWKQPNSGVVDTVRKTRKGKPTVSVSATQPSQNKPANSGADDTRNYITESDNEIKGENASLKGKGLLARLSQATKSVVTPYFREDDIIGALEEIYASGSFEDEAPSFKIVLEVLRRREAMPTQKLPLWLK